MGEVQLKRVCSGLQVAPLQNSSCGEGCSHIDVGGTDTMPMWVGYM